MHARARNVAANWLLRGYPKDHRLNEPYPNPGIRLIKLPGGEWHITSDEKLDGGQLAFVQTANADDMVALAVWADAVHRDGGMPFAIIPYLPGARQDRRQEGEALSAVVYAQMINACNLEQVVCLDPHSDVMPSHINNLVIVPSTNVCLMALTLNPDFKVGGVIIPDAGAGKRASNVAAALKVPTFQALKHRDMSTGKLSHFTCEPLPADLNFLVVDDICDGGGTFKGLAEHIKVPRERLALYVSHGIFSHGAEFLGKYFGTIFATDSHHGSDSYSVAVRHSAVSKESGERNNEFILPIFNLLLSHLI